jgi:hypothetical protein
MIVVADIRTLAEAAPLSFLFGLFVGFWLSSFYRIVRRNGGRQRGNRDD